MQQQRPNKRLPPIGFSGDSAFLKNQLAGIFRTNGLAQQFLLSLGIFPFYGNINDNIEKTLAEVYGLTATVDNFPDACRYTFWQQNNVYAEFNTAAHTASAFKVACHRVLIFVLENLSAHGNYQNFLIQLPPRDALLEDVMKFFSIYKDTTCFYQSEPTDPNQPTLIRTELFFKVNGVEIPLGIMINAADVFKIEELCQEAFCLKVQLALSSLTYNDALILSKELINISQRDLPAAFLPKKSIEEKTTDIPTLRPEELYSRRFFEFLPLSREPLPGYSYSSIAVLKDLISWIMIPLQAKFDVNKILTLKSKPSGGYNCKINLSGLCLADIDSNASANKVLELAAETALHSLSIHSRYSSFYAAYFHYFYLIDTITLLLKQLDSKSVQKCGDVLQDFFQRFLNMNTAVDYVIKYQQSERIVDKTSSDTSVAKAGVTISYNSRITGGSEDCTLTISIAGVNLPIIKDSHKTGVTESEVTKLFLSNLLQHLLSLRHAEAMTPPSHDFNKNKKDKKSHTLKTQKPFVMPKVVELPGETPHVVLESQSSAPISHGLAIEKDEYNWWKKPLPIAENDLSTVFMSDEKEGVPLSRRIARMHAVYEDRTFTGIQLENYAMLTQPTLCGWVKYQPMPFNALHLVVKEIKQLTSRKGHAVFYTLALRMKEAQLAIDQAIDALLDTINNGLDKKNAGQKKINDAIGKITIAQKELIHSTNEMMRDATAMNSAPCVQDAVLLSVPNIVELIINTKMNTLEYCAAMLFAITMLAQKINAITTTPIKNKDTISCEILPYMQKYLSPTLVRDSYDLLSCNEFTIQGKNYPFPFELLTSHCPSIARVPASVLGDESDEVYTLSLLLHLTKEHVLASFVPYLRTFTQPDNSFASSHAEQIVGWTKKMRCNEAAAKEILEHKEDNINLHQVIVAHQTQYKTSLVAKILVQVADFETSIVHQLYGKMNVSANSEIISFSLRLENIHRLLSEVMHQTISSVHWEKAKKLQAYFSQHLLNQPILVQMRIGIENRKAQTFPIALLHPTLPDSTDYHILLKTSKTRMQWYDNAYLFQANRIYRISTLPLSPTVALKGLDLVNHKKVHPIPDLVEIQNSTVTDSSSEVTTTNTIAIPSTNFFGRRLSQVAPGENKIEPTRKNSY
ncbi:MAG: hypothetical protein ABI597_08560 [Gammaproteobacteria bacterium]